MPALQHVLTEYALGARAQAFAPYLGAPEDLPPQVVAWARENAPEGRTDWRFALALGDAWHRIDARLAAAVKAAGLPMPERAERLDAISAGERPWLNPRAAFALPQLGRAARSDARARAQVRRLRAAVAADLFRTERGRWPAPAELGTALGSGDALAVEQHGDVATVGTRRSRAASWRSRCSRIGERATPGGVEQPGARGQVRAPGRAVGVSRVAVPTAHEALACTQVPGRATPGGRARATSRTTSR